MSGFAFIRGLPALFWAGVFVGVGGPLWAQQFTTAQEVRPILDVTKGNWVGLREYDGQDYLYFTHLLAWRCGLSEIHYAINGGKELRLHAEPCYDAQPVPNALRAEDVMPYVRYDLGAISQVSVRIVYDDGGEAVMTYQRAAIMIP